MRHFLKGENVSLITSRIIPQGQDFNRVFISKNIIDTHIISDATYIFPLYLYQEKDNKTEKIANLNEEIVNKISRRIGLRFIENSPPVEGQGWFTPEQIFDYIYAVLHSPTYRMRYKEFLKIDFPRAPFPKDAKQFFNLTKLGEKLRKLHLLENVEPMPDIANFPITGTDKVEKIRFYEKGETFPKSRIYINESQYFENVDTEIYNFYIGGYQPAQKWLKDRKDRKLQYDDIIHYQRIIRVLKETGEIMKEIDLICVF